MNNLTTLGIKPEVAAPKAVVLTIRPPALLIKKKDEDVPTVTLETVPNAVVVPMIFLFDFTGGITSQTTF